MDACSSVGPQSPGSSKTSASAFATRKLAALRAHQGFEYRREPIWKVEFEPRALDSRGTTMSPRPCDLF
jgi:hypothetical protein